MTSDVVKLTVNISCHTQSAERPQGPADPHLTAELCAYSAWSMVRAVRQRPGRELLAH